jgi:hypothetical protein
MTDTTTNAMTNDKNAILREFQALLEKRELATLNLAGVVIHAIGNLNLNDPPAALRTLMLGFENYTAAQRNVDEFHREQTRNTSQSQSAAKEAA